MVGVTNEGNVGKRERLMNGWMIEKINRGKIDGREERRDVGGKT